MLHSGSSDETLVSQTVADGADSQPQAPTRSGQLGRYALLGRVGAGGMGEVYAAYDPELDRRVAIKVLHSARHQRGDAVLRLRREAQALARLRHENVVSVHDVGTADGVTFVAMEFVQGETLREWLGSERTPGEILGAFAAAGQGLFAAHKGGLVHRDFKPENVMVAGDGRVVVMDFGLARGEDAESEQSTRETTGSGQLGAGSQESRYSGPSSSLLGSEGSLSLTRTGAVMGTPAYMSPEQHLGQPADARADQFAWCVAVWEAVYKERPFQGRTLAKLAYAVTQGELQAPRGNLGVSSRVHKALERGLSVRVADRWPDMGQLLAAVAEPRDRARSPWVVGLGLAAAAAVTGVAVALAQQAPEEPVCPDYADDLVATWGEAAQEKLAHAFARAPETWRGDAESRTRASLDRYASKLTAVRAQACTETRIDATQSDEAMDLRMACAQDRELAMTSLLEVLRDADLPALAKAPTAAAALPGPDQCLDVVALRERLGGGPDTSYPHVQEVERGLARIAALRSTGQIKLGRGAVEELAPLLVQEAGPSLRARFSFAHAELLVDSREKSAAATELTKAFALGMQAGQHSVAADAAILMVRALGGMRDDFEGALRWEEIARAADLAAGTTVERVARRENNVGIAYDEAGKYEEAKAHFENSARLYAEAFGAQDVRVSSPLNNVGISLELTGKYAEARSAYERSLAIMETALGPSHPRVGRVHNNLSSLLQTLGDHEGALAHSDKAVEIARGAFGPDALAGTSALVNRCWALLHLGQLDAGKVDCDRAVSILAATYGKGSAERVTALLGSAWLEELREDPERAVALYEEVLALDLIAFGSEDLLVCGDRSNLGHAQASAGHWAKARASAGAVLERAAKEKKLPDCGARGHLVMALVLEHEGKLDAARAHLDHAQAHYGPLPPGYKFEKDNTAKLAARLTRAAK